MFGIVGEFFGALFKGINWVVALAIFGSMALSFYDQKIARHKILEWSKSKGWEHDNFFMLFGLDSFLMIPSFLMVVFFFIFLAWIYFTAYKVIGFERTLILLGISVFVRMMLMSREGLMGALKK